MQNSGSDQRYFTELLTVWVVVFLLGLVFRSAKKVVCDDSKFFYRSGWNIYEINYGDIIKINYLDAKSGRGMMPVVYLEVWDLDKYKDKPVSLSMRGLSHFPKILQILFQKTPQAEHTDAYVEFLRTLKLIG